jgi:signal transduction histidine kinase
MLSREGRHREELKEAVKSLEKANFELKRAQNDIIRAEKFASTGRLSSGIAHEIGNPIAIVLGYLELLKRKTISDEEKTEFIDRSLKEIERIKSILAQLLEFSKKTSENLGKMRINRLLQDILNLLQYHPSFSKIEIIQKFSANSDEITSNENHLRQVFLNVLMNAADAIGTKPEGASGKIFIETRNTVSDNNGKELVEISISDNGPGISEKDINIIFDPFYTTKEPGEGTGLGLFVSYMIVEKLGGKIQAENNQDEGAKFSIQLPV